MRHTRQPGGDLGPVAWPPAGPRRLVPLPAVAALMAVAWGSGVVARQANAASFDPALTADRPWTRFLAEAFPEGIDPERSREPLSIREPGPDTANYPNGPDTLPRGGVYLEYSPIFYTTAGRPALSESLESPATRL